MYLPLLKDLNHVGTYSWRRIVLACLYCELCRVTKPKMKDRGDCCLLLQSWTLYQKTFLALVSHQSLVLPLLNKWIKLDFTSFFSIVLYFLHAKYASKVEYVFQMVDDIRNQKIVQGAHILLLDDRCSFWRKRKIHSQFF